MERDRESEGEGVPSKKPKLAEASTSGGRGEEDLWGEDLDDNTVDECFLLASQAYSQAVVPQPRRDVPESRSLPHQPVQVRTVRPKQSSTFPGGKLLSPRPIVPSTKKSSVVWPTGEFLTGPRSEVLQRPLGLFTASQLDVRQRSTATVTSKTAEKTASDVETSSATKTETSDPIGRDSLLLEIEQLRQANKRLQDQVLTREGEASILRSQLNTSKSDLETQRLRTSKEFETHVKEHKNKIKELQRQLELTKTELQFKTLEVGSAQERCRMLESQSKVKLVEPEVPHSGKVSTKLLVEKESPRSTEVPRKVEKGKKHVHTEFCRPSIPIHEGNILNSLVAPALFEKRGEKIVHRGKKSKHRPVSTGIIQNTSVTPALFAKRGSEVLHRGRKSKQRPVVSTTGEYGVNLSPCGVTVNITHLPVSRLVLKESLEASGSQELIKQVIWLCYVMLSKQRDLLALHKPMLDADKFQDHDLKVAKAAGRKVDGNEKNVMRAKPWFPDEEGVEIRRALGLLAALASVSKFAANHMTGQVAYKRVTFKRKIIQGIFKKYDQVQMGKKKRLSKRKQYKKKINHAKKIPHTLKKMEQERKTIFADMGTLTANIATQKSKLGKLRKWKEPEKEEVQCLKSEDKTEFPDINRNPSGPSSGGVLSRNYVEKYEKMENDHKIECEKRELAELKTTLEKKRHLLQSINEKIDRRRSLILKRLRLSRLKNKPEDKSSDKEPQPAKSTDSDQPQPDKSTDSGQPQPGTCADNNQPQSGTSTVNYELPPGKSTDNQPQPGKTTDNQSQPGKLDNQPQPDKSDNQPQPSKSADNQPHPGTSVVNDQPQPGKSTNNQPQSGTSTVKDQPQPGKSTDNQPQTGTATVNDQPQPDKATDNQPQPDKTTDNQPQPGTSAVIPQPQSGTSAVIDQPQPLKSTEQPQPGTTTEQPQPGTSTEQPQPGTATEQPQPGTSTEQPKPVASTDNDDAIFKKPFPVKKRVVSKRKYRSRLSVAVKKPNHDLIVMLEDIVRYICEQRLSMKFSGVLFGVTHLLNSIALRVKINENRFEILSLILRNLILCRPSMNVLIELMDLLATLGLFTGIMETLCCGSGPAPYLGGKLGSVYFFKGEPRYDTGNHEDVQYFKTDSCMLAMLCWLLLVKHADIVHYVKLGRKVLRWATIVSSLGTKGPYWIGPNDSKVEIRNCQCRARIIEALIMLLYTAYKHMMYNKGVEQNLLRDIKHFLRRGITFLNRMAHQDADFALLTTNAEGEYQMLVYGLMDDMKSMSFNEREEKALRTLAELEDQQQTPAPAVECDMDFLEDLFDTIMSSFPGYKIKCDEHDECKTEPKCLHRKKFSLEPEPIPPWDDALMQRFKDGRKAAIERKRKIKEELMQQKKAKKKKREKRGRRK